jgi:hypothetical protein
MKVKPMASEGSTKKVKGVECKWCKTHGWCKHLTSDCRNIKFGNAQTVREEQTTTKVAEAPRLAIDTNMQALVEDEGSDSY